MWFGSVGDGSAALKPGDADSQHASDVYTVSASSALMSRPTGHKTARLPAA